MIQSIERRAKKLYTESPTAFFAPCLALSAQAAIYSFNPLDPNHMYLYSVSGTIGLSGEHGRTVRNGGENHGLDPASHLICSTPHRA